MAQLAAINPLDYITDWTPIPEEAMDASGWFENEYLQVTIWDDAPGTSIGWFMAQGWAVVNTERHGPNEAQTKVNTSATAEAGSSNLSAGTSRVGMLRPAKSTSESITVAKAGSAYTIYNLRRRKLQSERVLQDMIDEFTKAYNEGRLLNDRRFDEILSLHDVMLARTEAEITAVASAIAPYDTIVDTILSGLEGQFDEYKEKAEGLVDGYGDSHRTRINTQFDNELSKAQQMLVSRGLHNATIWASVSTGIEQKRAESLTDLEDKILDRSLNVTDRVQTARNDLNTRLENSATKLREMKRSGRFDATDFRNKILTAMLAFAERRTDEYPGVAELANLAASLGFAEGGMVAPPKG